MTQPGLPATRREPQVKTVGGITFTDPYAWLQTDTEESLAWQRRRADEAKAVARSVPCYDELVTTIRQHHSSAFGAMVAGSAPRLVGGRWFHLGMNEAGTAQAIRVGTRWNDSGRIVVDAAELSSQSRDGVQACLQYLEPSPDGRLIAFSVDTSGGSQTGVFRVVDVDSGALLDVEVPALLFNLPRPAWLPDGTGFFLADRAAGGRHQVQFVPVAESARHVPPATFSFDDVPATLPGMLPQVSPGGKHVVAVTGPHEHLAAVIGDVANNTWRRFAPDGFAGELHGDWLDDDTYVAIATDSSHGRVVAIPAATSTDPGTWRQLVAPSELVMRALQLVDGHLVVAGMSDAALDVRVFTPDGTLVGAAPLPELSGSFGLLGPGRVKPRSAAFLFTSSTFTTSDATYQLDPATAQLTLLASASEQLDGISARRHFAVSGDGTRIPYFVIARDDVDLTTPQPTVVNAYGGFNAPWAPSFLAHMTPFVRSGGVFVQASLRGGSEYGQDWYHAGRRRRKQNVFDDLRAVAEDLIARGQAVPKTLAFHGASNGGLLAGVAITQQSDLWRVVVPQVPLFDMLEPVADVPGADAVRSYYFEDYGNPGIPEDAATLQAYSPYHNVTAGTAYPAVFQIFGANDLGCHPFHGRKFTAALHHATASDYPILLRVWDNVGHGSADPQIASEQHAEWLAFVMRELGMAPAGDSAGT